MNDLFADIMEDPFPYVINVLGTLASLLVIVLMIAAITNVFAENRISNLCKSNCMPTVSRVLDRECYCYTSRSSLNLYQDAEEE